MVDLLQNNSSQKTNIMKQLTSETADSVRKKITRLKSDIEKLDIKKTALESTLRPLESKLREIENEEYRQRKLAQRKEVVIQNSQEAIMKKVLANDSHYRELKVAGLIYLREFYFKVLEVENGYKIDQDHNKQYLPVYRMENIIAKIGACIQVFTPELLTSKPFDQSLFIKNKKMIDELHPIWDIATWWRRLNKSELMTPDEVIKFFDELLHPYQKILMASKKVLNATYSIMYNEKVWQDLED